MRETEGPGVVGKHPVLHEGRGFRDDDSPDGSGRIIREGPWHNGAFIYQSCSGRLEAGRGSFGGRLRFVPGTLEEP